ncbi:MAG: LysE family transporter, partial [Sphingomonadales bacterium]
ARSPLKTAPMVEPGKRQRTLVTAFNEGLLTSLLSPKVSMFYLAVFPQFITQKEGAFGVALILLTIHAVLNLIWFSGMILLLSRLTKVAQGGTFQRWLKVITGTVFIGFGVKLATLTRAAA